MSRSPQPAPPRPAALDRPAARLGALFLVLLVAAALAWIHREDLLPADPSVGADPFSRCLAARSADIDQMLQEGVLDQRRASLFKSRAEALCRDQAGRDGGAAPR